MQPWQPVVEIIDKYGFPATIAGIIVALVLTALPVALRIRRRNGDDAKPSMSVTSPTPNPAHLIRELLTNIMDGLGADLVMLLEFYADEQRQTRGFDADGVLVINHFVRSIDVPNESLPYLNTSFPIQPTPADPDGFLGKTHARVERERVALFPDVANQVLVPAPTKFLGKSWYLLAARDNSTMILSVSISYFGEVHTLTADDLAVYGFRVQAIETLLTAGKTT